MKKSACIELLFTEVPIKDRFGLAQKSGFDHIEFWSWKDKPIQKIKELCRANDLRIASFSGDQDFSMIDADQKADYVGFVQESIETAKFLSCENLVIHSNALGENGVVINDYPHIPNANKIATMFDVLKTLATAAEKSNVTLVLEALNTMVDHPGNFLTSTRQAAELIRSVNSSHIKILYDIYHMQIMEGNIINTLNQYIDTIGYIHIADVPGRHEPGTGEINFTNVIKTLQKLKYDGIIGFELTPLQDSTAAVQRIRDL
ncbi:MAG: TIM barrel protein [Desulfobacterales bacterium]|jgi:hydroxypyruvate isomerase